jgi:cystathionine beta-synthase
MREKNYDQLPVTSGKRLVGLVTLGNLLSRISHGRASPDSPVSEVMFDFTKISEVVTDPRDFGTMAPSRTSGSAGAEGESNGNAQQHGNEFETGRNSNKFIEITMDTPLGALNRFLEWQSAAIVTEREASAEGKGTLRPVGVVTKVDLLTWMVSKQRIN